MYFYNIYGLNIASEIEFYEALPLLNGLADEDVIIKIGDINFDVKAEAKTVLIEDDWYFYVQSRNCVYYGVGGFLFLVQDAKNITVKLPKGEYKESLLRTFLLGTILAIVLMQREYLPIHGAAVVKNNIVSIISGFSGIGKSAILSALLERGYRYLSDDISIISYKNGAAVVLPAYPQRKLTLDSAQQLSFSSDNIFIATEDSKEKLHIRNTEEWCNVEMPLCNFIELSAEDRQCDSNFTAESYVLHGHDALKLFMRNLYREAFHRYIGFTPLQMKQMFQTVSTVKTIHLTRRATNYPIRDCASEIIKLIE